MNNDTPSAEKASSARLNQLRAAVLGANDGLVSTSSVVMGVAGATSDTRAIVTAGLAALVAGALSMAVGEYVSVSSQSDAEKAYIAKEKERLASNPKAEFEELVKAYQGRGLSEPLARTVATELSKGDVLKAHLQTEFNLDEDDIVSPTQAAVASFLSFTAGGLIPFLTILVTPAGVRIQATVLAVVLALIVTGYFSAKAGGASRRRAVVRVIIGGLVAMAVTYYVGRLFGAVV